MKILLLALSVFAATTQAAEFGDIDCPAIGGRITNRTTGEYIYLTAPMMGNMSDCSTVQVMLHMRSRAKDGSVSYDEVALTQEFMEENALELIRNLPFLSEDECPIRSKKNCLVAELEVSMIRDIEKRRAPRRESLNADTVIAPFGLTAFAGKNDFNEAIIGTLGLDLVMFAPNFLIHGTAASMAAARKAKIKTAMEVLTGTHKKKTEISMRSGVFKKLVQTLEAYGS